MAQEVRPVWTVGSPLEGEIACNTLREHGIKCDCVEMPSQDTQTSPTRWITTGNTGLILTVVVASEDAERAHQILEDYTHLP
jgi:hypothetical protein